MRHLVTNLTLACLTALALVACGGGGGSSGGGGANNPPTANAGTNQTVNVGVTVTLNGSASTDSDGSIATYAWTQTAGAAVTLTGATTAQPTFVAPDVSVATTFTFSLVVTDNRFAASGAATVNVVVNPAPNNAPTANAGVDQAATSGDTVTLDGTASTDADGSIATYAWTQSAGTPAVTLSGGATAQPSFTAPTVAAATALTFSLVVTDNRGAASAADTVDITINPAPAGTSNVTGTVTFVRIPTTAANGLDYAAPQSQPARGILVRAVNPANQAVLATATTTSAGAYSMNVSNNTTMRIDVVAQMSRTGALPNWDFRVKDGLAPATLPYVYNNGTTFNSSAGGAHDVAIPSGFNATGVPMGTRASAPFAILDTVYQGMQTILGVAPTTNFPALVLDWATNNPGGATFFFPFDDNGAPLQNIVLSAEITEDTDEFDQHVIAHEFGHYIEFNFSRADNIGGAHGIGDKLDIRTAFGEGFGYAFGAIVLNDPDTRDTFVDEVPANSGNFVGRTSRFNVETNPSTTAPGTPAGNYGCWCSESSVWSILWDVYDAAADANDAVALGFTPIWNVLIGAQKNTPAVTSIFSFITALKAANLTVAPQINTLVAAQNTDAGSIDAFGTGESHRPTEVAQVGALPVFTTATVGGGAVVVQTVNDAGTINTLGNHRFVRFTVSPGPQLVTMRLTTSNIALDADPDFLLYRNGEFITGGEGTVVGSETKQISLPGGAYVLDVYDCGNVCTNEDGELIGTQGDYALTMTITSP
jgi:hypothetical protein